MFKYNSTIFKEQLTSISTVLNNTGNTTKLLTSFSALDVAQQKVLLSSKLLTEEQKIQCATMATLTSANTKYTAEQIAKATGVSAETLANWGLIKSTDTLTISELAEKAASDAQAKSVLEKIIAQNAQAVANGEVTASNVTLATSEGGATLATGAFTTAIKANIKAMWTWMTTTPVGWITMLVGGVLGAVTAYNVLTDSVEETKEKAEDLISTYKTALDTANSHKESIDNIADRYGELSKGVNNLGENVSLTAEEYQEYNSIVNDIAEMFPTMVQGYTDEGNAILKLKGNVDALRESYEAEAQAAYNSLITTGKDSDGNDILKDANNTINGGSLDYTNWGNAGKIEYLDKLMNATNSVDDMLELWNNSLNSSYQTWFEDFSGVGGTDEIGKLTDEDLANIRKNAKILKQQYQAEIDSAVDNAETLANAYLMTNEDYAKLDEQSKNAASIMVNSLNADIVSKFGEDKENVGKYVDDIVQIISTNPDAKDAMIGLFTMDTSDMPVDDIQYWTESYINTIAKILGEDPVELKVRLGFDYDNTEQLKTKVQGFLKDEYDDKVGTLTKEDLDIASKLEIPEGTLLSWDELIAKIEEAKNAEPDKTDILSFSDAWEKLKNSTEDETKELADNLTELAEKGQLTVETLSEADTTDFFKNAGISAEEAVKKINDLSSASSQLNALSDQISKMSDMLADKKNGTTASASDLSGFDAKVRGLDSWAEFESVMGSTTSTMEECQAAANALATEWVNSNNFLANLNETNKDYYETQLTNMGVANASTIVENSLIAKKEVLKNKTEALSAAESDLGYKTKNASEEFLKEANMSDIAKVQLADLIAKEQIFNAQGISVSGKIRELNRLANAYFGVSNAIQISSAMGSDPRYYSNQQDYINAINEQWDSFIKKQNKTAIDVNVSSNGSNDYKQDKGSEKESKKESKPTIETFDFIETALKRIEDSLDKIKSKAESTFMSFKTRAKDYKDAISKTLEVIDLQEKAKNAYMGRANAVGLSEDWAVQVRDGSINIADVSDDDTLKQQIKDYQEWYEKARECENAIADLKKEQDELVRASIELIVTKYDKLISKVESANNRIENKISLKEAWGGSASVKDYDNISKNNVKQIRYYKEQNASLKELQKTVQKGSESWYEYQKQIDSNNESAQNLKKNLFETAQAAAALPGEIAKKKVEKYDSDNELLDAKIDNTVSTKKQNSYIDSKIDNIGKKKKPYNDAVSTDKSRIKSAKKGLNNFKSTKENKKLLSEVKKSVKAGKKIPQKLLNKIANLDDNGKLLKACAKYNSRIDAYNTDKEAADLFAQTSIQDIADLELEKFNNIQKKWDNSIYKNEQKEVSLNNKIDINEASGNKKSNQTLYKSLISNDKGKLKKLQDEKKELENQLNAAVSTGKVKVGSDEWLEMSKSIDEVSNSIDETTKSILDYQKAYHQLKWDLFDSAMETIKRVNSESDYYIQMMSYKDLVDEESGSLTDYGNATLALHKNNYDSYLAQAEQYEKEYNKIMKQIKTGELSATDKEVIDRIRELEDARRSCKTAAEDEKKAIKDLLQSSYDKQLEVVSELISKYKDLMNAEKDAYEYQRTIEEKVKNIATLQKRLNAYSNNDDTEENRARIQKIKLELEEAQQDLKDTQYDKYISDTSDMLDELYDDLEEFLSDKLDNTNAILEEISTSLGDKRKIIETLKSIDSDLGSKLEALLLGDVSNSEDANDTVKKETKPPAKETKPTIMDSGIVTYNGKSYARGEISRDISRLWSQLGEYEKQITDKENALKGYKNLLSKATKTNDKKSLNRLISETTAFLNVAKKEEQSIIEKLIKLGGLTKYAKGSHYINKDQLALLGEEGAELHFDRSQGVLRQIGEGDKVFTNEMSENLWKLAKVNPEQLMGNLNISPVATAIPEITIPEFERNVVGNGDVNVSIDQINLPNVKNYEEFKTELIKDNKFEKAIQAMTIDKALGSNSLSKYKFK